MAALDELVGEPDDIEGRLWPERFATVRAPAPERSPDEPLEDFEPLELAPVVWVALEVGEA